ncbi:PAS and helix-turn-helix domain-containing protein [Pseudooceanicola aestuarii]|uniref:PAS and helix-turn-helix domain-containing protein n=1 Tax=Pseudooceanicola aestuarii TaxID=2697319 RepID=UPI0013D11F1A|nr:PAS and helix-turn-helix domain-containing protein [Pseudooceanicola aestuarii]
MDSSTRLAFDLAPVGLVLAENRVIRACNQTFAEMVGQPHEALPGQSFRTIYADDREFDSLRDIGLPRLRETGFYTDERLLRRANGSQVWVRFRARAADRADPMACLSMSYAPISPSAAPVLTPRERDVVTGLARGRTSKEIAASLGLSPRSVEDVRARLLRKFDVRNAAELLSRLSGPAV